MFKDFLAFANDSPVLAVIFVLAATNVLIWPFRLVNRWIRHRNIVAKGWPPPHLDGDGDAVEHGEVEGSRQPVSRS